MAIKKFLLFLTVAVFSCSVEENTPTTPTVDDFDTANATLIKQGTLMGVGHTASGVASIYEYQAKLVVHLNPFSSQNGPDLKVYLSKDANASEYIRLGVLKSTMGKQSYEVPGAVTIADYKYVHIWCEKYSVVFAIAEMK